MQSLIEIGLEIGSGKEEFFFRSSIYFHYFIIISTWKKEGSFIKKKIEFLLFKDDLCEIWFKLAQWFWRKRFFKILNVFSQFRNFAISPWEMVEPFFG